MNIRNFIKPWLIQQDSVKLVTDEKDVYITVMTKVVRGD